MKHIIVFDHAVFCDRRQKMRMTRDRAFERLSPEYKVSFVISTYWDVLTHISKKYGNPRKS